MNPSQEDRIEPLQESSIPSRSRKRDGRLTVRLLSLFRKLDYAIIEIYEAGYDRRCAANVILLSVQCVESVGSRGSRGRTPEEVQTGAIPAMGAMLIENDCLRLNETHILL